MKLWFFITTALILSCNPSDQRSQKMKPSDHQHTNALINETSPYLLQHAHNPVDWHAWNEETLEKAKRENKPLLISIGYSACHWCHVMEHESFEDTAVAAVMNQYFINVKVDREERPDIDQIYMSGVQLMTGSGGWPLNTVALPDGRPFWGGTYFRKEDWMKILKQLADLYQNDYQRVEEYATQLTEGIAKTDLLKVEREQKPFTKSFLATTFDEWSRSFDTTNGGYKHAPKFPLPNNYELLLKYGHLSQNEVALDQVELTLTKMAHGGMYDQLGGGFARYSVDGLWKVPHFEKMLYDNGQLIGLYARAFQKFNHPLFREVVYQTIDFVAHELSDKSGAFYSALDADSEGEEGKFYVWKVSELKEVLGEDYPLFADYFRITKDALWEQGNYILMRTEEPAVLAQKYQLTHSELEGKLMTLKQRVLEVRNQRVRPGLDDKCLTSWNAMMLSGLLDAYAVFGEERFLQLALDNAKFIEAYQTKKDGGLWHSYKNGTSTINGFLEDYAFVIEAYIKLYQNTLDESWIHRSKDLTNYAIRHFHNEPSGMFYFTSDMDPALITRKTEVDDNVIPSSNSVMAKNLEILGIVFGIADYENKASKMLHNMKSGFEAYPSGYSNWGQLMLNRVFPSYELVICGKEARNSIRETNTHYLPNIIMVGSESASELSLLKNRFVEEKTLFYLCQNKVCNLPEAELKSVLNQIINTR